MRTVAAALLTGALLAPAARADDVDPVSLDVTAPAVARAHVRFAVTVAVSADAGALDPIAGPLRMRVKLTTGECGGSYDGTSGQPVMDAGLSPQPAAGAAYSATASGRAKLGSYGVRTVCAYLEDDEQRQFATATDTTVDVSKACTSASKRLTSARTALRHARRRHASSRRVAQLSRRVTSRRRAAVKACR